MDDKPDLRAPRELLLEIRPIVTDWFDTGYEAGRLDPDELTLRILKAPYVARLLDLAPKPECVCEGEFVWACGPECGCWHHAAEPRP